MTNGPDVKKDMKDMEDHARHLRYLKQNAQTPIEKLENDKLGRVLTREELDAVQWYVSEILGHSQTETKARSIVVSGGIEYILRDFKMHADDIEWIENKKQSLKDMCRLSRGTPRRGR
ncbi:MAG: hypothetical protein II179_02870 [Alphaproteobacteria bacterium]|nr:hypothetical protein [Alphaproteobacteria bacterium]